MSEEDIAYRIGLGDRPEDTEAAHAAAEAAQAAAAFAAAAAAAAAAYAEAEADAESEAGILFPALPVAGTAALAAVDEPGALDGIDTDRQPEVAAATSPVLAGTVRERAAPEPLSQRYRLWRDSAAVLLVISIAVLGATTLLPGLLAAPVPSAAPSAIAVVETATPTAPPTAAPTPSPSPSPSPSPTPTVAPTPSPSPSPTPSPSATPSPTPRKTPRPTPRPTQRPRSTPRPTPRPTPKPTPKPTPRPTPRPTAAPVVARITGESCAGTKRWTFTAKAGTRDWRYRWDLDGTILSGRTVTWNGWAYEGQHVVVLTVSGKKGSAQDFTTVTTPCP
jgi:hypothetical protein